MEEQSKIIYQNKNSASQPEKVVVERKPIKIKLDSPIFTLLSLQLTLILAACQGGGKPDQNLHDATMEAMDNRPSKTAINDQYENIDKETNTEQEATKSVSQENTETNSDQEEEINEQEILAQDEFELEALRQEIREISGTATSEARPTNPFEWGDIKFDTENPIQMSFGLPDSEIKINFSPVVYKETFSPEEGRKFMNETYATGEGTAYTVTDKYGNLIVSGHSGYIPTLIRYLDLEFEELRQWFEGASRSNPRAFLHSTEHEARIEDAVGSIVEMEHPETGEIASYEIAAVGYVPNMHRDRFISDVKSYTDVLVDITGNEESPFYRFSQDENAIYVVFCGWGYDENDKFDQEYTRYVIALTPKN